VKLKDFGTYAQKLSETVKTGAVEAIQSAGRPVVYLNSSRADKEEVARKIAAENKIEDGPVCALTCVWSPATATMFIAIARPSNWIWCSVRANACSSTSIIWTRSWVGGMRGFRLGYPFRFRSA